MKHIKPYKIFESQEPHPGFPSSKEEIHRLCKEYRIDYYHIKDDLTIDVTDNVILSRYNLEYLPLNFNHVIGFFNCTNNNLISLKGAPKKVGGCFDCSNNKLKSLEYSPIEIGYDLSCMSNEIMSLKHFPTVKGNIGIAFNPITFIVHNFILNDNKNELISEFNHYRIIEENKVYMDRLEMFLGDYDIEAPSLASMDAIKRYYTII